MFNKLILATLAMVLTSSFALARNEDAAAAARKEIEKQDKILVALQVGISKARRERNNAVIDLGLDVFQSIAYGVATKALYNHSYNKQVFPKTAASLQRALQTQPDAFFYYPMKGVQWAAVNGVRATGFAVLAGTAGMTVVQWIRGGIDTVTILVDSHQIHGIKDAIALERKKLGTAQALLEESLK